MVATALSADPKQYRKRLADQTDDQIDGWVAELLRDVVIRRGIVKVVEDFRRATRLDERGFERVFASGGGPPAVIGRDAQGRLDGPDGHVVRVGARIRAQVPDARERLIEYLVENSTRSSTSDRPAGAGPAAGPRLVARLAGLVRLTHPFPVAPRWDRRRGRGAPGRCGYGDGVRLGTAMTALQASIGALNDIVDAPGTPGSSPASRSRPASSRRAGGGPRRGRRGG